MTGSIPAFEVVLASGFTALAPVVIRSFLSPQIIYHLTGAATIGPYGLAAVAGSAGEFGWLQVMTAGDTLYLVSQVQVLPHLRVVPGVAQLRQPLRREGQSESTTLR